MSSVWEVLSAINVNEWIEKKGQFSYLSWTQAWAAVKGHYPEATYHLWEDTVYPDGTREVRMEVTIENLKHIMWLPVLDFKNNPIANPNAFDINTTRMRCLVKCLAMHGLGHYIYAGESIPRPPSFTAEQKAEYIALMAAGEGFPLKFFAGKVGVDVLTALFNDAPKNQITKQKGIYRLAVSGANAEIKRTLEALELAVADNLGDSIIEMMDAMTPLELDFIKAGMSEPLVHSVFSIWTPKDPSMELVEESPGDSG